MKVSWISSRELADLLGRKTRKSAIKLAKKYGIKHCQKKSNQYRFDKTETLIMLQERKKFMTTTEVITAWGISRKTLLRWIKEKLITPAGRRKTWLFKKGSIIRFKPKTGTWLNWQIKSLESYYNTKGGFIDPIAKSLGKSVKAVKMKASNLGLGKNKYREFYFLTDVADFFKTNMPRVKRWIDEGKLMATIMYSTRGEIRYRITEESIAKFMAFYPGSWRDLKPSINLLSLPEYTKLNQKKIRKASS